MTPDSSRSTPPESECEVDWGGALAMKATEEASGGVKRRHPGAPYYEQPEVQSGVAFEGKLVEPRTQKVMLRDPSLNTDNLGLRTCRW